MADLTLTTFAEQVTQLHKQTSRAATQQLNCWLTVRNWLISWHIAEHEQGGSDRAAYWEQLLPELARRLRGIRGASAQQLYRFRDLYRTYPAILSTLSRELQRAGIVREVPPLETSEAARTSGPTSLPGLAPEVLLSRLSFSRFLELLPLDNALQRAFYEGQAVKNSWSVRE